MGEAEYAVSCTGKAVEIEAFLPGLTSAAEVDIDLENGARELIIEAGGHRITVSLPVPVSDVPTGCTLDVHTHRLTIKLLSVGHTGSDDISSPAEYVEDISKQPVDENDALTSTTHDPPDTRDLTEVFEELALVETHQNAGGPLDGLGALAKKSEALLERARDMIQHQLHHIAQLEESCAPVASDDTRLEQEIEERKQLVEALIKEANRAEAVIAVDKIMAGGALGSLVESTVLPDVTVLLHTRLTSMRQHLQARMGRYQTAPSATLQKEIDDGFGVMDRIERALKQIADKPAAVKVEACSQPKPRVKSKASSDGATSVKDTKATAYHGNNKGKDSGRSLDYSRFDYVGDSSDEEEEEKNRVKQRVNKGVAMAKGVENHMDLIKKIIEREEAKPSLD